VLESVPISVYAVEDMILGLLDSILLVQVNTTSAGFVPCRLLFVVDRTLCYDRHKAPHFLPEG
jgi:hypothetical protein